MSKDCKECKLITIYSAWEDTDKMEGRGSQTLLGYFLKESDAKTVAKGMGAFGRDGDIRPETAIDTPIGIYALASTKPITVESSEAHGKAAEILNGLSPEVLAALKKQLQNKN